MSYTPTNDPLDQGLFDITRTLLQQPDLCALARSLAWHARQMNLADRANILLWQPEQRRVYLYSTDEQDRDIRYEDEPLLANGPFRRMLSRPDVLHCQAETFKETWPALARLDLYTPLAHYCLTPLAADGRIFGGCEFLRNNDRPWSDSDFSRLQTLTQAAGLAVEQLMARQNSSDSYEVLCRERNDFRLLVAITNAVLSKLDLDELVTEVSREIQRNFGIDSISMVLRSERKGKLLVYSTHYLDKNAPLYDQSEVDEKGTLSEKVMRNKKMLMLNLHSRDQHAPYERMLFDMWGEQDQTLCLFPLIFRERILGTLKLAQCKA